ncbi:MAG: acylneuraminate cytidylyltransferase family protein [Prevotellaceae bacterium]|jgi:CMP-N-acetylneuraminic acid synthetase|nr:acylneuraminate cytidylyltransferase family protein [Prevotellaceae bacterium]
MKTVAFLPCRKGSERVPNKNIRDFAGITGGLLFIKLEQLLKSKRIDEIILSSNDAQVFEIGASFKNEKIVPVIRPDHLGLSSTSTDDLIAYAAELIPDGTILWTHVTSPFITTELYDQIIDKYYAVLHHFDSLMSVSPIKKFIWNEAGAINYDRKSEKWPRTQTLKPLYEVNSGVFMANRSIYKQHKDRIGNHVFLYELSGKESFDIDWQEDFDMAELIYTTNKKQLK